MAAFNKDMGKLAKANAFFQKEVHRDANVQVVLMSLLPGEDIGEETHRADQTTHFVEGTGHAVIDGRTVRVKPGHMIVIPQGAKHNIVAGARTPLKLFSVYAPPAEAAGLRHRTKADAQEAEKGLVGKAVDTVRKALGKRAG